MELIHPRRACIPTRRFSIDINEAGQIVGIATTKDGHEHAVLWRDRKITHRGRLGGTSAAARGINDK